MKTEESIAGALQLVGVTFPHIHAMMDVEDLRRGSGRDLARDLIRSVELALSPDVPDEGKNLGYDEAQALATTLRTALALIDASDALGQ